MTQLKITREFDAPRELVYRAFTDPDQLVQWFGPVGFSVPRESVELDVRVGGHERFTMVKDDDPSFVAPVSASYSEVVENELIVGFEDVEGLPGFEGITRFETRLEFADAGEGRTRLTIVQGPHNEEILKDAEAGWESSFTKLDALLAA
ncbi:SRPBCC domain-containing protein [Actinocorallia sp. API 0066]|uniref:SRPBCC family protein n=1 Tax=Actinocorallia sp. API 0066 TaxID=2896846 RepID=UPI001E2D28B4|nr:SRPBCC domain-containing protein [Actinocorallia sp. API 0066]MCD0448260.1 SRPBCC domain-containing protein [Actinocorallia sp. API 0066]